jgi:hypothetical protein
MTSFSFHTYRYFSPANPPISYHSPKLSRSAVLFWLVQPQTNLALNKKVFTPEKLMKLRQEGLNNLKVFGEDMFIQSVTSLTFPWFSYHNLGNEMFKIE